MRRFFDRSARGLGRPHAAPAPASTWRRWPRASSTSRPRPERALDLGTGTGEAALLVAREFPRASVRGVDVSEAMIAEAKAKVGLDPEGRIAFKVADAADLPWPDDSFDLVVQLNMPLFFAEIARVLRPGGHVVVGRQLGRGDAVLHAPVGDRAAASRSTASRRRSGRRGPGHLLGRAPRRLSRRPRNRFRSMSDAAHTPPREPVRGRRPDAEASRDRPRRARRRRHRAALDH